MNYVLASALLASVLGANPTPAQNTPQNILVIVIDDLGVEDLSMYNLPNQFGACPTGTVQANSDLVTPALDEFAAEGVVFRNAYSNPTCSPTRAALLTGRHAFRTGIGNVPESGVQPDLLDPSEVTIPELLSMGTGGRYLSAAMGKWHVSDDLESPVDQGFDYYVGDQNNLGAPFSTDYFNYLRTEDSVGMAAQTVPITNSYITEDTANDAINWIRDQTEPWFLYLAFHAPHKPFHVPPAGQTPNFPAPTTDREMFEAAVRALDFNLANVKAALDLATTTVFILSDNGTPPMVVGAPFDAATHCQPQAKNTVYQGGVNVPLIVWGSEVSRDLVGATADELVQVLDVYSTVAEIAGIPDPLAVLPAGTRLDSESFLPILRGTANPAELREYVYSERFNGGVPWEFSHRTTRNRQYKLITRTQCGFTCPCSPAMGGTGCSIPVVPELYDLVADPFEQRDLVPFLRDDPDWWDAYFELRAAESATLFP